LHEGKAYVYSGKNGTLVYELTGQTAGKVFGSSVSYCGDVNGDGVPDFLVGASMAGSSQQGQAFVFSGTNNAALIYVVTGEAADDLFGKCVSYAGDVNADGRPDFIVGAEGGGPLDGGKAYVYSGANGSLLYGVTAEVTTGGTFGDALGTVGDINKDGYDDFMVGAFNFGGQGKGKVWVFSGVDHSLFYALTGDTDGAVFGLSVAYAGEVSGCSSLIIGAPGGSPGGGFIRAGGAYVYISQ
jgi:hypothetical protein